MPTKDQTVLVVGATSDIGAAIARRFADEGCALQLAGRNAGRLDAVAAELDEAAAGKVSTHFCDVLGPEGGSAFIDELDPAPDIAVCVVGLYGRASTGEEARSVMGTNYVGPALLLGSVAARFESRGHGAIVGISSVSGERGRARNAVYGSAKAGFTALLSGLRNRLHTAGVQVVTVKAGYVRTRKSEGLDRPGVLTASPEDVAQTVFRAIKNRRDVVYVPRVWRLVMWVVRTIPERWFKRFEL